MTKRDLTICQNVILRMRIENPKELKNHKTLDFVFENFHDLILENGYKGGADEALQWWNNQRNPNDN